MDTITTGLASQGGHWYKRDGSPAYEIPAKNGNLRAVTLRDARKLALVPSVTSIIREAAAPGLEQWKRKNLLLSALTLPRIEGESVDEFAGRVERDAATQAAQARDLGTEIHAAIEEALKGGAVSAVAAPVLIWLEDEFPGQQWYPEKSFASSLGFGGKVDLCGPGFVVDFKTKQFVAGAKALVFDDHRMQLAAYAVGLGEDLATVRAINLFVSTSDTGLIIPCEHTAPDLERGWAMFDALFDYWKARRGFDPGLP